jgi:hypothetical protein
MDSYQVSKGSRSVEGWLSSARGGEASLWEEKFIAEYNLQLILGS